MDADADADISTYQPEYRKEIETAWIVVSELKTPDSTLKSPAITSKGGMSIMDLKLDHQFNFNNTVA